jgi:lipocalin-like protein
MANASLVQAVLGTWKLVSYVREVLGSNERFNQFGENPAGYLGYSADGRMYAIFVRQDRITPGDVVPT